MFPAAALLLVVVALPLNDPAAAGGDGETRSLARAKAGDWLATVEGKPVGPRGARATSYRQQLLRRGPRDKEPVLLFEQTSTGRVRINLRDDGLLLVQPVGPLPRLYFPGSKEAVELKLPPPRKWRLPFAPSTSIGNTWFLDDCLFYSRMVYPGHLLVGFVRIDTAKKTTGEGKLCLEVVEAEQAVARAAEVESPVLRIGDYVLWVNAGYHNSFYPDRVPMEWKSRKVRALDLASGQLVDPGKVPAKVLRDNKDRLFQFVEQQAHNRAPELEIWAVGVLARVGGPGDAKRLQALSDTVQSTTVEVASGELETTDEPVKAAYLAALKLLEKPTKP